MTYGFYERRIGLETTINEKCHIDGIAEKLKRMRMLLNSTSLNGDTTMEEWHHCLSAMKEIAGNAHNDMNTIACLMAKDYLCRRLPMRAYDALAKAHGAKGLDIDEETTNGQRVIGEIKTTGAFGHPDVRQPQRDAILKDIQRLNSTEATHRFFFVVDRYIFDILKRKYASHLLTVTMVLLPVGEEFTIR